MVSLRSIVTATCVVLCAASNTPPPFSWDTVGGMVFIQVGNSKGTVEKPFEDATTKILAKYPFVCFEKFQGTHTPGYYEDKVAAACKAVKAINPKLSCFMYLNTELAFTGYRVVDEGLSKMPQYWLKKANGQPARNSGPQAGCRNSKCPAGGMLVPDYSNPSAAAFWFSAVSNLTRDSLVDGCNMDRSNDLEGDTCWVCKATGGVPANGGWKGWMAGKLAGLKAITPKAQLVINNIGTSNIVTGAWGNCLEGFGPQERHIVTLQTLAKEGLGAKAHCCRDARFKTGCSWENVQDGLAAFLIGAGENAFFACGEGFEMGSWIQWFPQYDKPLGRPLGPGVKGKDGVWTRSFASGTTVRFTPKGDHEGGIGEITWGKKTTVITNASIVV